MTGHEFFKSPSPEQGSAFISCLQSLTRPSLAFDPEFRHGLVVGFHGSTSSERALAYAAGLARRSGFGLILVHVVKMLPDSVWAVYQAPLAVPVPNPRTEVLGLELASTDSLAGVPWVLVERAGDICGELEGTGREFAASALVVGSTQGAMGRLFGSIGGRLAKRAQRPVIVIP